MVQTATYDTDTSDMLIPHGVFRTFFGGAGAIIAGTADADAERVACVHSYVDNVLRFLDAHHGGEDAILWPLLTARCSDEAALIARMEGEHEAIHSRRGDAGAALEAWFATPTGETAQALIAALSNLSSEIERHFQEEETEILPLASRHVSPEEWGGLPGHAMAHFSGDKIWLILGLVFEQMTPEVLATMLTVLPPPVIEMWTGSGRAAFEEFIEQVRSVTVPGAAPMYGSVSRYRLKPGAEAQAIALSRELEGVQDAGYVGSYTFRLDSGDDEYITAAVWTDRDTYARNADDERQRRWFARISELMVGEPQWSDGQVIHAARRTQ